MAKKKVKEDFGRFFDIEYLRHLSGHELQFLRIFIKEDGVIKKVLKEKQKENEIKSFKIKKRINK